MWQQEPTRLEFCVQPLPTCCIIISSALDIICTHYLIVPICVMYSSIPTIIGYNNIFFSPSLQTVGLMNNDKYYI